MKSVGLSSYPSALLVDSSGRIVFGGYPGEIDDEMVEKAVRGALTEPIYQWPDALEDAADAMRAGKLGKAISEAEAAGEEHAEYVDELVGLLDGRVDILKEAHETGDYLAVIEMAEELEEAIDGREQEATVQGLVTDITKNRDKRMVLEAQKDIAKMLSKKIKRKDVNKLIKKLEKLRAKHPDTIIDIEVDEAIEKLRAI